MQVLEDKVAVVTGAGSGIGLALARRFAREGMRVALADVDDHALASAAASLRNAGAAADTVLTQRCDVRSERDVQDLADSVFATWDGVDLLCNNAGVFVGGFMWERPSADFEFVLGVNLWGILHGIRAFVPRMIERGAEGHIVNTCSVAGLLASPISGPYGVSKSAALAATEALALDLAVVESKLKVTALCPGMVRTNLGATSQENRPAEFATTPTEDATFASEVLTQYLDEGIAPDSVADSVVSAIRDERFLVLTHPHHVAMVRTRIDELADGRLPEAGDYR